jgi:phosphatidylinositol kinase/protein kinase (PI-3  family)
MIRRQTGHVVHVDFGESFERTLNRERNPEKVPFRKAWEAMLHILKDNRSSVITQLEVFVHEPRFANSENGTYRAHQSTILDGKDPVVYGEELAERTVEDQVNLLIQIAADRYRYVNHYCGWCALWLAR